MAPPELTPLPKGILKNSSTVYDEVASYSTLPPDKVYRYWHVYTTTNKKLKDPTARRLENFWWHVWGSDRSKLSGRVLARIFQDISLGPTVVPLKGPPNRWEGPNASPLNIQLIVAHLRKDSKPKGKSAVRSSSSALHSLQLPPILKKVGSSSTSIAKSSTRFVSPQESAEQVGVESGAPSSESTLANDFDGAGHASVSNRANLQASDMFQRPQSPTDSHELASTSYAASKNSARNGKSNFRVRQVRSHGQSEVYSQFKRTGTTMPCAGTLAQNDHKALLKLSAREKIVLGKQPVMRRSQISNLTARPGVPSTAKPKRSLFTDAVSSTSIVAAQGTIIDQAGSTNNSTQISALNSTKDEVNSHGRPSISPLREARLTPTQPSSSASLPLGRTKSQLTLLLERAKERSRG